MKQQHSNRYPNIDYQFRPASYWQHETILDTLLRNVKGTERRKIIEDAWKQGTLAEVPQELLQDIVSDETREAMGRIHPAYMGGEYLPDYSDDETEIARIELESTLADVISIRAHRKGKRIVYSIVDEYETPYEVHRKSSRQPWSLRELIDFIEGSHHPGMLNEGLALCFNLNNGGGKCPERYRHFTRITSAIYPQLEEHFEHAFEDWFKERQSAASDSRNSAMRGRRSVIDTHES